MSPRGCDDNAATMGFVHNNKYPSRIGSLSDLMNLITGPTLSPPAPQPTSHWHFREISNMIYDNWDILQIDVFILDSLTVTVLEPDHGRKADRGADVTGVLIFILKIIIIVQPFVI